MIEQLRADAHRRAVLFAAHHHEPRKGLHRRIEAGVVLERPHAAERPERAIDELRIAREQRRGIEPQRLHRARAQVLHQYVGAINEFDVLLASASNAIVIGFNVRPDRNAADVADREKVDVRLHSVIYTVTDEIRKAMTGLLDPTLKEQRLGAASVRELFKVPKIGTIAGCLVTEGRITRSGDSQARVLRDNVVVFEGKITSLRRFKDDVSEVKTGLECGIGIDRFTDLKVGDVIEVFVVEKVAATA